MTIYLYTGTPGSGKSIHQAIDIYYHVKMRRPVIANFDINRSLFRDDRSFTLCENDELKPSFLEEYARDYWISRPVKEGAIKLYIDECSLIFSARDWGQRDRRDWIRFFQLHRKLGYDVFLISQMDTMIDKNIRGLVEYEVKHRQLNKVGWVGALANVISFGHPVVCAVTYWYGQKMRLSAQWMLGRKKWFRLYDTYKIFG